MSRKLLQTKKELANELQRSTRFASDMCKGGLRLPTTAQAAINFLRNNPHPTRFRKS